ncbi:MAG: bifunctional (p)ppGpp synthetase/guanosine-3',5'-bis(diphosphate) 3'-pyrophosphohydrolase [Aquabacterium sp.]|uniref:RelA/SpoT family protein n=1 Tax=Aquabacterium sp. TaxID=1872578 RepID=UPI00271B5387|nr:bifunctional (p)ppGpp synthetase/guanosine-3',5'-bis(diphosphate) 3'-pyrophosphohydrolase [Aquabacterium sp.]MDO9005355.1 bifunctional (p)ppGpp synthetase/guanosine-3',5'-bis(diphosphate) 3'-pyrophosphohydrolase [Aquabacterium sp.]
MKTGILDAPHAAIVDLVDLSLPEQDGSAAHALARARAFAEPLLAGQLFDTGENALAHADGVAQILLGIGAPPSLRAAAYLVYASEYLTPPDEVIGRAFGPDAAALVAHTRKLVQIQRNARDSLGDETDGPLRADQVERIRKMLLAFSRDLRVVLMRLASRLQTLRHYAATKLPCPKALARESMQVFAPLASRLGIGQIKWEMEDLSFRFLMPDTYRSIARSLDEKRLERERDVEQVRQTLAEALAQAGLQAQVQGRPKHLYSIWKKMQGKNLSIDRVFDVRALRVIVADIPACYAALSRAHEIWRPMPDEFSDYIARPKPNGYQSLHTVVLGDDDKPIEIQIRSLAMHEHADSGVAAHWAYKEAGAKGYAGIQVVGEFESRVAAARKTVLRQLLAWERDLAAADETEGGGPAGHGYFDDRIYVFTPDGKIIDLVHGATPVDFAYTLHTDLGHRCRGAKVDGVMVPLNTALQSGQTIEIVSAKEGGPSLDWLNQDLGYVRSPRARAKVRAWFNALAQQSTIAKGRELVEKLLQREGKTATKLEDLAADLGFRSADALFDVVGKDEFSLRNIEQLLRPAAPEQDPDQVVAQRIARSEAELDRSGHGRGVLVVGMDSLLTQLARCCKPAPPDPIGGYVTRGKGVAVHRSDCSNFRQMAGRHGERVIPVTWGQHAAAQSAHYAVDVLVEAHDRPGLLRDVCDALAQGKTHVVAMNSQTQREHATITLTVQTSDTAKLGPVLARVAQVNGVLKARRK